MDTDTQQRPARIIHDDEIDLRELACKIWQRKVWVVASVIMALLIAGAYLLQAKPVYQASTQLMAPTTGDLLELNKGVFVNPLNTSSKDSYSVPLSIVGIQSQLMTPGSVYQRYLDNLASRIRQSEYLPSGWELAVKSPRGSSVFASVSLQGSTSQVAETLNSYVADVASATIDELKQERLQQLAIFKGELASMSASVEQQSTEGELLQNTLEYLSKVEVDAEKLQVVRIDQSAVTPAKPVKPKSLLLLIAALIAGAMVGVFMAAVWPVRKAKTACQ